MKKKGKSKWLFFLFLKVFFFFFELIEWVQKVTSKTCREYAAFSLISRAA